MRSIVRLPMALWRRWGMRMSDITQYRSDIDAIKQAICESQARAAKATNEELLHLYFAIGGYVSANTRSGRWGTGAIAAISGQLQRELPGLRGFSERNLKYMRTFYEEWNGVLLSRSDDVSNSAVATAELEGLENRQLQLPKADFGIGDFTAIGFTHHCLILQAIKDMDERLFYIHEAAERHLSVEGLRRAIKAGEFHHRGAMPNNFEQAIAPSERALRAVSMFKDEYLLDFINVEQIGARDKDIDERMVERGIVHNIKDFIMTFGRDFTFVGNQYHLDAFGEDQYIDLLFFNRELNCLVAVELKSGAFKTSYLGQLSGYLRILDEFVRKPHESPSLGIVLCKDANRSFVDYVIRDYDKPMGVATYKTTDDMPEKLRRALPDADDLRVLLEG